MEISGAEFLVLEITQEDDRITIARQELEDNVCVQNVSPTNLNRTLFNYPTTVQYVTLICGFQGLLPESLTSPLYSFAWNFNDRIGETEYYFANDSFLRNIQQLRQDLCSPVQVPIFQTALEGLHGGIDQVQTAL